MKKIFIILFASIAFLSGCTIIDEASISDESAEAISQETLPEAVIEHYGGITLTVDPRLELLSIVEYLSEQFNRYDLITKYDIQYKKDVESFFSDYKDHAVISSFDELNENGLNPSLAAWVMLLMDSDFTLNDPNNDFSINGRFHINKAQIEEFFTQLKEFYIDSDFAHFYNSHVELYQKIITSAKTNISDGFLIEQLEDFFGDRKVKYSVVFVPLFHPGGFGPEVEDESGKSIYSIIGSHRADAYGMPMFGNTNDFTYIQLHEFGHSFIDLTTSDIIPYVERSSYLLADIDDKMAEQGYGHDNWSGVLEEIILRATTAMITYDYNSPETLQLLAVEKAKGFEYIYPAYNCMIDYEQNRSIYPEFQLFIPTIIEAIMKEFPE